jgi:hypothetical protein
LSCSSKSAVEMDKASIRSSRVMPVTPLVYYWLAASQETEGRRPARNNASFSMIILSAPFSRDERLWLARFRSTSWTGKMVSGRNAAGNASAASRRRRSRWRASRPSALPRKLRTRADRLCLRSAGRISCSGSRSGSARPRPSRDSRCERTGTEASQVLPRWFFLGSTCPGTSM